MEAVKLSSNHHTSYYPHSGFVYAANKKSLVGGKPWQDLSQACSSIIKQIIEEYKKKEQAKQILFSLVGEDFVAQHYDLNVDYKPHLLEVPYMLPDVRIALEKEFTSILCDKITEATSDPKHPMNSSDAFTAYTAMVSQAYGSAMAEESRLMAATAFKPSERNSKKNYGSKRSSNRSEGEVGGGSGRSSSELLTLAISTLILGNGFAIDDNEVKKNMRHHSLTGKEDSGNQGEDDSNKNGNGSNGEKGSSSSSGGSSSGKNSSSSSPLRSKKKETEDDNSAYSREQEAMRAPTHSHHSDLLAYMDGTSLVTDSSKWGETFDRESKIMLRLVIGRCCPVSLRRFMIKWRVFNPEHVALASTVIRRNMAIDKMTDPTISTVDNLLARATSQTFVDHLRDFDTPRMRGHVLALLNQYYTYSGSQHPSHVALAIPLLISFRNQPKEGPYLVSMFHLMLEMLPGGGPSRRDALIIARRIVDRLADLEPELFLHLSDLVNRARHYQQTLDYGATSEFTELAVFIKPWIENLLVGFVRRDAVLFIWDQCYLTGWNKNFEKFCLDVLLIIKRKLLEVKSAPELKRAMVLLPGRIHTRNLRESFAKRTKQYPEDATLDEYWESEPPLKRLTKKVTQEVDLERIEKLLSITGGANELRRHADLEARKNDIETKRDTKEMAICCRRGLVSKAQELLDDINIEVNDTTDDGRTFLYIAAEHSHLNLVQLLLKNDANPNLGEENTGVTPIMAAIIGANSVEEGMKRKRPDETAAVILALVNAGANINLKAKRTLLRPVNMINDKERERQIGHGVSIKEKDKEEQKGKEEKKEGDDLTLVPRGSTALHLAVACACLKGTRYYTHPQLVMILLTCGSDTSIINVQENTAKGIFENANLNEKISGGLKSALWLTSNKLGIEKGLLRTAATLRAGVRTGNVSAVKRVLKSVDGDSASLKFIIHSIGGLQKMNVLLEKSKKVNFHKEERQEVEYKEGEIAEWESDCATPLALASRQGYKDVVAALLEAGATSNVGLPGPITPLMQSFTGSNSKLKGKIEGAGHEACLATSKYLFENGADVLIRSCDTGETSFHRCAASGLDNEYENLKVSIPKDENGKILYNYTSSPDWSGNIPDNLIAEANGRPPPIKVPDGEALIKKGEHLDDFVEDVEEDDVEDPNRDQLTLIIDDVPEVEHMGDLYIPLSERVKDVDQLVGMRNLLLEHVENNKKLAGLVRSIMKRHECNEKKAKVEVQDSVDVALLLKMKYLKDDRNVPRLKARVKNKDGDPVVVKIRALMPGDDPKLAAKLATVTAKRKGLPKKAIAKLTKHVLAFSTKKTNYSAKDYKPEKKEEEEFSFEEDNTNLDDFTMNDNPKDVKVDKDEKDDKDKKDAAAVKIQASIRGKKQRKKRKEKKKKKKKDKKKNEPNPNNADTAENLSVTNSTNSTEETKEKKKTEKETSSELLKEVKKDIESLQKDETKDETKEENKIEISTEEECKSKVKQVSPGVRKAAIKSVGKDKWKEMSWKQRYDLLEETPKVPPPTKTSSDKAELPPDLNSIGAKTTSD